MIELNLIWNGSAILENAIIKKPFVSLSRQSHYDYPIDHISPDTIEEYEEFITGKKKIDEKILDNCAHKAAWYLDYCRSSELGIIYPYIPNRKSDNTRLNKPILITKINKDYFGNKFDQKILKRLKNKFNNL